MELILVIWMVGFAITFFFTLAGCVVEGSDSVGTTVQFLILLFLHLVVWPLILLMYIGMFIFGLVIRLFMRMNR